ncbi:MAG: universal stress protein [Actinomycetia bacterium]|nr:universal stress protein [Actinomycetes bacterium]MCP4960747.1 universal stress protein [Actinomycetes bacterium]
MRHIVVGVDGSSASRAAFREAVLEAELREATVIALHAVSIPVTAGVEYVSLDLESVQTGGEAFVAAELEELASEYGGDFPVPVHGEVRLGHCGVQLINAAEDHPDGPAELVVLGSRGLGGFRGLLLGSVTTYAVHHLTTKLLIVPEPEQEDG